VGLRRARGRPARCARRGHRQALRRPALGGARRQQDRRRHQGTCRRAAGQRDPVAAAERQVGRRAGPFRQRDQRAGPPGPATRRRWARSNACRTAPTTCCSRRRHRFRRTP
jgi:hypothetical protein